MGQDQQELAAASIAVGDGGDAPSVAGAATQPLGDFGEEFRHLTRQRRFGRTKPLEGDARDATRSSSPRRGLGSDRLSHDPSAALMELSRMADRVIEAREAYATQRARADRAEHELESMNDRLLAARALVYEAQRTARVAAERCSFVEGRCEALEEALDRALNASLLQRWKWRRQLRSPNSIQD